MSIGTKSRAQGVGNLKSKSFTSTVCGKQLWGKNGLSLGKAGLKAVFSVF